MYDSFVIERVKETIREEGIKLSRVVEETHIPYQRLSRLLCKRVTMNVNEFVALCKFSKIDVGLLVNGDLKSTG